MKIFQTEAEKKLKESQIAAKPENTAPYTARRTLSWVILTLAVIAMIAVGIRLLQDRKYNLVSVIIAFLSCLPFYMAYEKREGSIRRLVLIAVMTAIAVSGRLMFGPLPYFKPMIAIVILTGIYMGPESGFLVGRPGSVDSLPNADVGNPGASAGPSVSSDAPAEEGAADRLCNFCGRRLFVDHGYLDSVQPGRGLELGQVSGRAGNRLAGDDYLYGG